MIPIRLRSRIALGLSPTPRPGLVILPLGMAFGPAGLNLLSGSVLAALDPVVSVSLAALGIFAGLGLDFRRPREGSLLAAASVEAGLTILLVGAGVLIALSRFMPADPLLWQAALLFGIAAAASSTTWSDASEASDQDSSVAARVGDLDDALPILLSGFVLASMHHGFSVAALVLAAQAGLIALVIAVAGWLLAGQASARSEQHVFLAGSLLLLGGAAAYLSMSALWIGFVAGTFWSLVGGSARESIDRDMRYLQHPLMVLLLLVAGARLQLGAAAAGVAVVYVAFRIVGKLAGSRLAGITVAPGLPSDLGRRIIAPGVMAVALAVNVLQAGGDSQMAALLLAVTVLGTFGSEFLSIVAHPKDRLV
jgi:hypothetical protein